MPVRPSDRGATLPLTLVVMALMSLIVATAFSRVSRERRINGDQQAQVSALAVAQSGLELYRTTVSSMPGTSADVTLTGLPGGSAQVSLRRVRDSVNLEPAIYVVSSRGTSTSAVRYGATAPPAQRTVAQYMTWEPVNMTVNAAFTSLSGLDKNGNSGALDGNDGCVGSGVPPIPGVAVPNALYTGQTNPINGNPDNAPVYLGTAGTAGTAKDAIPVDWDDIVNNNAFPPNYVMPGAWPTPAQMNQWPVIRANGNLSLDATIHNDSKGILIVTGDLTLSGSFRHDGIVLVGGVFVSNGNNQIHGAIITGLNVKLGAAVAQTAIGNGTKTFQYNSCNILRALRPVGSLEAVSNAWVDNYPSY
jgi:type II secretory pathway pseudopilin PulG